MGPKEVLGTFAAYSSGEWKAIFVSEEDPTAYEWRTTRYRSLVSFKRRRGPTRDISFGRGPLQVLRQTGKRPYPSLCKRGCAMGRGVYPCRARCAKCRPE